MKLLRIGRSGTQQAKDGLKVDGHKQNQRTSWLRFQRELTFHARQDQQEEATVLLQSSRSPQIISVGPEASRGGKLFPSLSIFQAEGNTMPFPYREQLPLPTPVHTKISCVREMIQDVTTCRLPEQGY